MTQPYPFIHGADTIPSYTPLTPSTRKRLPQRGFVQVGLEEVPEAKARH